MACTADYSTQIAALATSRLDGHSIGTLLDHVEGCPTCSEELEVVAATVSALELGKRRAARPLLRD